MVSILFRLDSGIIDVIILVNHLKRSIKYVILFHLEVLVYMSVERNQPLKIDYYLKRPLSQKENQTEKYVWSMLHNLSFSFLQTLDDTP